jgi:hypothetical protein
MPHLLRLNFVAWREGREQISEKTLSRLGDAGPRIFHFFDHGVGELRCP